MITSIANYTAKDGSKYSLFLNPMDEPCIMIERAGVDSTVSILGFNSLDEARKRYAEIVAYIQANEKNGG